MTAKAISPLRQRLIEDMAIRRLGPKTQHHYIRHVKRKRCRVAEACPGTLTQIRLVPSATSRP